MQGVLASHANVLLVDVCYDGRSVRVVGFVSEEEGKAGKAAYRASIE